MRLVVLAVAAAVALVVGGAAWELLRFGASATTASRRLETEVRSRLGESATRLRSAAAQVADQGPLIEAAAADRDRVPMLFAALPSAPDTALTVYVQAGAGDFRVLAWSDGPAEDLVVPAVALDAPAITVAQGTLGLRLVAWHPVRSRGRSVGVVAAEQILSTTGGIHPSLGEYRLPTSFGPVLVARSVDVTEVPAGMNRVTVVSDAAAPVIDIVFAPAVLDAARAGFRRRVLLAAAIPFVVMLLMFAARLVRAPRRVEYLSAALLVLAAGALLTWAARLTHAPLVVLSTIGALTIVGIVMTLPIATWWRSAGRRAPSPRSVPRMVLELIAGGVLAAVVFWLTYWAIDRQLTLVGYDRLASPLFPPDLPVLTAHAGRLFLALASFCAVTAILARLAERWRISWRRPVAALLTAAAWVVPTAIASVPNRWSPLPISAVLFVAGGAAVFALSAGRLRRFYRHSSQSARLLLLCAVTIVPALFWYPVVAYSADRSTEHLIETQYAPATVDHPQQLREALEEAKVDIDNLPNLDALLAASRDEVGEGSTDAAFLVWSQTGLSRSRLTSAIELFDPDGRLASRFALNVPEFGTDQSSAQTRCQWETYGEAVTFGAEELAVLHAERSICDESGRSKGAVFIHLLFDYRALPFISAINPYDDLLRLAGRPQQAVPQSIQTVVYGWGRVPLFTSGQTAWPLDPPLLGRIESSRQPFWTTRRNDSDTFRVYFANDRAGIYAFGYPTAGLFEHLSRLAESAAVAALIFVAFVAVATVAGPLVRRPLSPLRALVSEIRTSFYRKLFLFFVFTAVVPVVVLAFTFSAYMSDKLRGDVETEALNAATVARRVLEDTIASQQVPPTDDVLVLIGQVINQDVNLYDGSALRSTSQRDLFDSGLLPERTPAAAYRAIALDRLPSFIDEDRAGSFRYLVAAAPVPALGRQFVLTVPLALRQEEIEREITELNRGVLLGAILVILLAAFIGASVAQRVSDPVSRLTRATRQIAAGRLDVRIVADTADELRRLVNDFNSMAVTLREQRAELGRAHELKAWADMSRQVAHDVKNPLTPIQLAAEHLQHVHEVSNRPLGVVFDQCIGTVLSQVKQLRQIANEFSTFAATPVPRLVRVPVAALLEDVVQPYRAGLAAHTQIVIDVAPGTPDVVADRTLLARALTNLIENALQALSAGGVVRMSTAREDAGQVLIMCEDNGVGMPAESVSQAFEPHFSTKTGGSGLGLANARRNVISCGGTITIESVQGQGTIVRVRLPEAGPIDAPATA
ncbi:MAG TPA: ATP-binding protein [Vicinamibacterales bacterium]|nr:ATP-binding protein [Vicinamibacterales bacterium]